MSTENQPPIEKLKDRRLEIAIWKNTTENGTRYTSDGVVRSYKVGDEWKKTRSLSGAEHLRASRLLDMAYSRILELEQSEKEN